MWMLGQGRLGGIALAAALVLLPAAPAAAAPFTVNTTADHVVGACDATDCTLREAMTVAKTNGQDDTITVTATGTINLTGELPIPEGSNHLTQIVGPGAGSLVVRAQGVTVPFEVLEVFGTSAVEISGLTITNGYCNCTGGALYVAGDLTLDHTAVTNSIAASGGGGGIVTTGGGHLMVLNSTISGNQATGAGVGGGILVSGGTTTIKDSTISGNTSSGGGGINSNGVLTTIERSTISGNHGGDGAGVQNLTTLVMENSTVAGNLSEGAGGGIDNYCAACTATATLNSVSIVGNVAHVDGSPGPPNGGGILQRDEGNFTISNTLVTGNTISHGAPPPPPDPEDCDTDNGANVNSLGGNLVSVIGDCTTLAGQRNVPGLVGPLAFNGGPTQTVGLLPGSPAHDAGSTMPFGSAPACPVTDQRGVPRGGAEGLCDIGAFEGTLPTAATSTPAPGPAAAARAVCKKKKKKKKKRRSALAAKKKKKKKKKC